MSIASILPPSHNFSDRSSSGYVNPYASGGLEPNHESLFERYDRVWDKDTKYFKQIKSHENQFIAREPPKKYEGIAFYVLRSFDERDKSVNTTLTITSEHLCEVINIVLPDMMLRVVTGQTKVNPHVLYHYLDDFRNFDFGLGMPAKPVLDYPKLYQAHLAALVYFLNTEYEYERAFTEGLLAIDPPHITFDLLWLIFKPTSLILTNGEVNPRLYRVKTILGPDSSSIILECEYVAFNGEGAGFVNDSLSLYQFEGVREITKLSAFPFEFCTPRAPMETLLEKRGRKYIEICQKGRQYICRVGSDQDSPKGDGRLIIDAKTYAARYGLTSGCIEDLDEIHYQLCGYTLWGFSVVSQKWETVHVNEITDITWKEKMLDNIVLEPTIKTMIKGLVNHHDADTKGFQDIIPGKGAGLVMLFSGPPGVGKTLTAEAVAEATHRPIYRISANDLGCEPEYLEENLSEILRNGVQLGIILLLDEADVFLEQRTSFDVKRNSLVSVFLRELEYYSGILILTTNRVDTFDRALESRIHFNLRFPEMDRNSRMQLWEFFLKDKSDDISLRDINQLSEFKLNGRAIKHAVSLGFALAKIQNQNLSLAHIRAGLKFIDPSLSTQSSTKLDHRDVCASPMDPAMTPRLPVDVLGANRAIHGEFRHPGAALGRRGESIEQNGSEIGRGSKRVRRS